MFLSYSQDYLGSMKITREKQVIISATICPFFYKYIFKYASQLKIMDSDVFYKKYIENDFEEKYVPLQFEEMAKQYLIRKNRAGLMEPGDSRVGHISLAELYKDC